MLEAASLLSLLSQSHSDLKRPRSVSLHKHSNTEHDAGLEPRKRKRDNTLLVEPSGLHGHSSPPGQASQDALIGMLLKELEDEQSKTKAFKEELERLKNPRGAAEESSGRPKSKRGKFTKHSTRREKKARANQLQPTTLSMGTPSMTTEPNQRQPTTLSMGSLSTRTGPDNNNHLVTFTKFEELPDTVQDIIFGMLLKSHDPIKMDTAHLTAFVQENAHVPTATLVGEHGKHLLKPPHVLQPELEKMKADLYDILRDRWPSRPVVPGLTLLLLYVSKAVHHRAARLFYSNNVFEFPNARNAWLHLESFLITIGPSNASNLQHISVAAPQWFPDACGDNIAGTVLDALSPITRLAAFTDPAEDRLLSAISTCTSALTAQGGLKSFQIKMKLSDVQLFLKYRLYASDYDLSTAEKGNHVKRKEEGIRLLRALSDALGPGCKPVLVIDASMSVPEEKFVEPSFLSRIEVTAERYGWDVEHTLVRRIKISTC